MLDLNRSSKLSLIFLLILTLVMIVITSYFYTNMSVKSNNNVYILDITETHKGVHQLDIFKKNSTESLNKIAKSLGDAYESHDALILYHPRDKLTYTASCLAFMMENITKPIVVTNDTINNDLIEFVKSLDVGEVLVLEDGKLLKATRAITQSSTKIASMDKEYIPIATPSGEELPKVMFFDPSKEVLIVDTTKLTDISQIHSSGVILLLQDNPSAKLISDVKDMIRNGAVVAHTSYSEHLEKAGSLFMKNMTLTSIYAKLLFTLSNVQDPELVKQVMMIDMREESGN
jgi:hypothetical protein